MCDKILLSDWVQVSILWNLHNLLFECLFLVLLFLICYNYFQRRRTDVDRRHRTKEFELEDAKKILSSEATADPASTVDELHREISVSFLNSSLLFFPCLFVFFVLSEVNYMIIDLDFFYLMATLRHAVLLFYYFEFICRNCVMKSAKRKLWLKILREGWMKQEKKLQI